jgi:Peptidase inhibitor I78 family
MKAFAPFLLVVGLAACAPEPEPLPLPVDPNADLTPGWNDKEPDTCHAGDYQHLVGQPAVALDSAGIARAYRVIAPGGMVSQEYDSQRIDVYLGETGTILRLTCG